MSQMDTLEAAVRAAPNTKLDVKTGVKTVSAGFREFAILARRLGITRNPDVQEQRMRALQTQQQQQHAQTIKTLKEIQDGLQHKDSGDGLTSPLAEEQGAYVMVNAHLAKQSEKIDAIAETITRLDAKPQHKTTNDQWTKVVIKSALRPNSKEQQVASEGKQLLPSS